MGRLTTIFIVMIVIQMAMVIYSASTPQVNALYGFAINSENWTTSDFVKVFTGTALAMIIAGIAIGSVFGFKTDFIILAPVIAGILSLVAVFSQFAGILRSDLAHLFGCPSLATEALQKACMGIGAGAITNPINMVLLLIVGVPAFYFAMTVLDWWRNKD